MGGRKILPVNATDMPVYWIDTLLILFVLGSERTGISHLMTRR